MFVFFLSKYLKVRIMNNKMKSKNKVRDIILGIFTLIAVFFTIAIIFTLISTILFRGYGVLYSDILQITILPLIQIILMTATIILLNKYVKVSKYYSKTLIIGLMIILIFNVYDLISNTILFWM